MDDNTLLNPSLVAKSIGFHGQPLQKIWEGERGNVDLLNIGVINPDYSAYQSRQKHFTFQNRAKRLRLHQFIAKNANMLFRTGGDDEPPVASHSDGKIVFFLPVCVGASAPTIDVLLTFLGCTTMPPYDSFFFDKMDKSQRLKHVYSVNFDDCFERVVLERWRCHFQFEFFPPPLSIAALRFVFRLCNVSE